MLASRFIGDWTVSASAAFYNALDVVAIIGSARCNTCRKLKASCNWRTELHSRQGHVTRSCLYVQKLISIFKYAYNEHEDDYGALEPSISGKIMELHHKMHHNTYVNSFNNFSEQLESAESKGDIAAQIALQPLINFHGGGHLNHSLFWENLAPQSQGGGEAPSGKLEEAIRTTYGSLDDFKSKFNTALAGIQGSGWAWLVKDKDTGNVTIKTYAVSME